MKIEYHPIGIVHSPFKKLEGMPKQPNQAKGVSGKVEVFPQFLEGLKDLEGFSHIILLCHFHMSTTYELMVIPPGQKKPRGLFSTRAPVRPNPIGLSVVRLNGIQEDQLLISDFDILDQTPVLDIKSYYKEFEDDVEIRRGWLK